MRIEENNKAQFTKDIETLLRKTRACEDIELTYGSLEYEPVDNWGKDVVLKEVYDRKTNSFVQRLFKNKFTPSERNLENKDDSREYVQINMYGKKIYQSVEADSYWGMVLDIVKRLREEGI